MISADWMLQGISLTMEQFTGLVGILPQLEGVLKSKGVEVPRPQYDTAATQARAEDLDESEEDDEEEEFEKPKSKGKLDKYKMKSNHEATSDEDED